MIPLTNKSQIFEHLNQQADKAKKEGNQLMLALIAACDESLRRGMVVTSNHIAAIIILCQDRNTANTERVVMSLYGKSDIVVAETAMEMVEQAEYDRKLKGLEEH